MSTKTRQRRRYTDVFSERTLARYGYDGLGRLISQHMADQSTSSIYYAWEDDGDLDAMRHVFAGTVRDFAYDYNANGELTATYASDGSWMWSATSARTVNYDPTNARNEMLSWTDDGQVRSASYDANGNYQGNGVDDFTVHNSANQMLSYTVGTDSAAYRYGPMGRRIETMFNGTTTRFVHAGDMEIAELVQLGGQWKIKTRYIPGPGVDQRVAMITVDTSSGSSISREYYHADRLGSVLAMVSESGAVMANYVYTPYGVEDYGASGNPFRYTGRRWDAAVGLYYYRARYYDPDMGRFLETDPVLYADQMNLYAYVGNSPLNATDPTGMFGQGCYTGSNVDGDSRRKASAGGCRSSAGSSGIEESLGTGLGGQDQCDLCERYGGEVPGDAARRAMGQDIPARDSMFSPTEVGESLDWFYVAVGNTGGGVLVRGETGLARSFRVGRSPAAIASSRDIALPMRQLQRKFKHAPVFGITGTANTASLTRYAEAIVRHVRDPATRAINGTYRRQQVTHFFNPNTGVNVVRSSDGRFVSGWRLSTDQLINLLNHGGLGGG